MHKVQSLRNSMNKRNAGLRLRLRLHGVLHSSFFELFFFFFFNEWLRLKITFVVTLYLNH